MDGDLVMDFMETMFINHITMGITGTIYITGFIILLITMLRTTEIADMPDTTIIEMLETTGMANEILTIEEAMHILVRAQTGTLKEMPLQ